MSNPPAFTGSVPKSYHQYLVPLIFERYAEQMAAMIASARPRRVLELACGTGVVTRRLLRALPAGASFTATDLNESMLEVAKSVVSEEGAPGVSVRFQNVDACSPPFPDRSFDAIACQYGVMFFPDKVRAMREARRVLVPGGRYVFSVWDSLEHNPIPRVVHETLVAMYPQNPPSFLAKAPYAWFDRAEIERVVRAGGFERVNLETVEFPSAAPSAEDAARALIEGTPIWPSLLERGVTDAGPIRAAVAGELSRRFGASPCRSTVRAIVVTAS
jgi:ubiquinone/menaquinone biosynthesis C-methylase UbiE